MRNGCFGFALGLKMQNIYKHQAENVSNAVHCKEVENSNELDSINLKMHFA